jgi:hypothetical protein
VLTLLLEHCNLLTIVQRLYTLLVNGSQLLEKQKTSFFYLLLEFFVVIFHVYITCSCNHFSKPFWLDVFHPWIQDIDERLNNIQMDGCHSIILELYLSIQYVCIMV